ncbi:acyl-CoA-binding protein [Maribacter stanieri]|jgi:acyl-CoA-binding protein|uniref:acyl-CoA-binding protein n=1 Tax=Maribacter stanieri TaxID=440514 RepID=UPI0024954791|nr:acyl-CoA-binding protein [Maribacter stanieri]|tara:strand:+ start:5364 stop:5621 length:258 start_codon:yes stop_codon:yes gene_type:complete
MKKTNLHIEFEETVTLVNNYTEPIPADILLKLYAYYKIANSNFDNPGSKTPLINAFKANALFQAKNMSKKKAMRAYIELATKELK